MDTISKTQIDSALIQGCDKDSRIYCDTYNKLNPLMLDGMEVNAQSIAEMSELDLSALGLYIGKFVEKEINSSVVQLMRHYCGVEMPEYYCIRCIDSKLDCDVQTRQKTIRLNEQIDFENPESLRSIPLGDAYYALEELKREDGEFFAKYAWLSNMEFLSAWRKLFMYRNRIAHIGDIINKQEFEDNYKAFCIFLKYMPQIYQLKIELAPQNHVTQITTANDGIAKDAELSAQPTLPLANISNVARYKALEMAAEKSQRYEDYLALSEYKNKFDWKTTIFTNDQGLEGMRDPSGNTLIPAEYEIIAYTYDTAILHLPVIPCQKNGKFGLVSTDGKNTAVTPFVYDSMHIIDWSNHFFFKKDGSLAFGILKADGTEIMPCILDSYNEVLNDTIYFRSGSYCGLWQRGTDMLLQPIYDNIEVFDPFEPLLFTLNGELGYVNFEGEFISKKVLDAMHEDDRHDFLLNCICDSYE